MYIKLELFSNSTWLLVGSWLFCMQHLPCSVYFQCASLEALGRFEQKTSYIIHWRSNSFWHAKEVLKWVQPLMNQNMLSSFKFKNYHWACTTSGKTLLILYARQPMENHRDQLPTSYLIELYDNSTMRWKPSKYRWLAVKVKHWSHTIDLNHQNRSDCDKWNLLTSGIGTPFFSGLNLEGGLPSSLFVAALTICTATDFDLSFVCPSLLWSLPAPKIE